MNSTARSAIFWPVVAQVALTAAVWVRMYFERMSEMRRRGIHPQRVATSRSAVEALQDVAAADNFRNLFEIPVLFYTVCCALAITAAVTPAQLGLAWTFVVLRAAHSAIHLTYNRVVHRFVVYVAGALCVFAMWLLFAATLWERSY